MLRAFRFSALLDFVIAPETLNAISRERGRIRESAQERVCAELFKIMDTERAYRGIKQMAEAGLLALIIPELASCSGCSQNTFHTLDVFNHTLETFRALEHALTDPPALWHPFSDSLSAYVNTDNHKVLMKWVALLHDVGKPPCRTVEATGRIRFLGHESAGAAMAQGICQRLKMSKHDRSYIAFMIQNHLRPLLLFNAYQRGDLTPKGITRFVRKFQDHAVGLMIHAVADQQAKGQNSHAPLAFIRFGRTILDSYFSVLKPKMKTPRLLTGHDLMETFGLKPSRLIGSVLEGLEEARLNGEIGSKEEALALAARMIGVM
jgi:putative nucleotidyltransferase with HDIG domain